MKHQGTWMLTVAVMALLACSDGDEVFGDRPRDDDGGGGAGSSQGEGGGGGDIAACVDAGDSCTACEVAACEQQYCECYGNTECGLYASCIISCPEADNACYQACATDYAGGITDGVLLNHCAATACEAACSGYPLLELTSCQLCMYEGCESAMNTCLANPACTELVLCLDACALDTTCQNGCYASYPDGIGDATPVGTCAQAKCTTPCFGG